ncbi:uncharacterized protein G2W53_015095 [Senna tora]|uniref:Uncharacterized protein n=1 Tax=Senna tora TaxID=362788 RepID=A0A834WUX5_9FABA|nr:uncharacterized protein G2W53_015095 [Senna tora]
MISISKFCDCNHKFLQHISNLPIHSHIHRRSQIILFIHNIYTSSTKQEPVENPKQSGARDFPHLPPNQTLPLPRRRRLLLLHSPEALLRFLRQDQMQRDDGAERSDATRRQRREICPVAMDPASMVKVFAADESV